jgi:hypothetical protein
MPLPLQARAIVEQMAAEGGKPVGQMSPPEAWAARARQPRNATRLAITARRMRDGLSERACQ